jgi:hypothetical protein
MVVKRPLTSSEARPLTDNTIHNAQYNMFVFPKAKQGAKYAYFEPNFKDHNSETVWPLELETFCGNVF